MIRAIVFDCFGVLVGGSLEYLVSLAPNDRRQAVYDAALSSDYGYITMDEFAAQAAEVIGTEAASVERIIREKHVRREPMLSLARSLKGKYRIGLLSNAGRGVIENLFTAAELGGGLFDAVVVSSDVGAAKPEPAVYRLVAERLGVRPEECVMIDDVKKFVEGAEAAGMRGIQAVSAEQVGEDLAPILRESGA